MRSPKRRHPSYRVLREVPPGIDLEALASRVSYVGSPEHKDTPSFAGRPVPRADATICDPTFVDRRDEIEQWLRDGIRKGCVGAPWEGDSTRFPRYVWYAVAGRMYEARLVNREQGQYKGWELQDDEWPEGLKP